jgi:hypothetical protein
LQIHMNFDTIIYHQQVRIIWHNHKLCICRSPEDRVVRPREPHHFEGEGFRAEVPHVPKHDRQIDLDVPMEWRSRRPQCRPRDAHVIKR